jgi:hypothetical protein
MHPENWGMGTSELPEEYEICADYSNPRHESNWTRFDLVLYRCLFNFPLLWLAFYTFQTSDWGDLIYYESEWGVFLSAFASILQFLADHDKRVFTEAAVLVQEVAFCINCVITPVFWLFLAKTLFAPLPNNKSGYWLMFIWGSHHVLPIVTSFANLYMNK